jgi:hypothetical protein
MPGISQGMVLIALPSAFYLFSVQRLIKEPLEFDVKILPNKQNYVQV